jgi:hypothetical protein
MWRSRSLVSVAGRRYHKPCPRVSKQLLATSSSNGGKPDDLDDLFGSIFGDSTASHMNQGQGDDADALFSALTGTQPEEPEYVPKLRQTWMYLSPKHREIRKRVFENVSDSTWYHWKGGRDNMFRQTYEYALLKRIKKANQELDSQKYVFEFGDGEQIQLDQRLSKEEGQEIMESERQLYLCAIPIVSYRMRLIQEIRAGERERRNMFDEIRRERQRVEKLFGSRKDHLYDQAVQKNERKLMEAQSLYPEEFAKDSEMKFNETWENEVYAFIENQGFFDGSRADMEMLKRAVEDSTELLLKNFPEAEILRASLNNVKDVVGAILNSRFAQTDAKLRILNNEDPVLVLRQLELERRVMQDAAEDLAKERASMRNMGKSDSFAMSSDVMNVLMTPIEDVVRRFRNEDLTHAKDRRYKHWDSQFLLEPSELATVVQMWYFQDIFENEHPSSLNAALKNLQQRILARIKSSDLESRVRNLRVSQLILKLTLNSH